MGHYLQGTRMFSLKPAAQSFMRALPLLLLLFASLALFAQCPVPQPNDPDASPNPGLTVHRSTSAREEPLLPEAGFLSNTHYTSRFFGFGFDLPLTVEGHEIMMPVMPERQHALLSLQYENNTHRGYIEITAIDPKPGHDLKTPEQEEAEAEAALKQNQQPDLVEQQQTLPGLPDPDFSQKLPRFHSSLQHDGKNFVAEYWTPIKNYMVKIVIGTNDKDFLHKSRAAMQDAQFYCTDDDGTLTDIKGNEIKPAGEPYEGPAVPTFRVNAALRDKPADAIPSGQVTDGVYRNQSIGLRYKIPAAWRVLPPKPDNPPIDPAAQREFNFLHACSQTLLRAGPTTGGSGAMMVLRALDPNCLSMHTPTSLADKNTLDEVGASLEQLGGFGEVATDQLVMLSGQLFMVFDGTYESDAPGEELGRRLSQTIFATRHNKLLLVWTLQAPTAEALDAMPMGSIALGDAPAVELAHLVRAKR